MKTEVISKNNLSQSRPNWTNKSASLGHNSYQTTDSIPTIEQLSLFDSPLVAKQLEIPQDFESDKPFPLQICYIRDKDRTAPDRFCRLIHYESKLNIPGQYTHPEAEKILLDTRDWDWELNSLGIPRCRDKLLLLLDKFTSARGVSR